MREPNSTLFEWDELYPLRSDIRGVGQVFLHTRFWKVGFGYYQTQPSIRNSFLFFWKVIFHELSGERGGFSFIPNFFFCCKSYSLFVKSNPSYHESNLHLDGKYCFHYDTWARKSIGGEVSRNLCSINNSI